MEKLRFITDLSRSPDLMQELAAAGTTPLRIPVSITTD
jgi:hypothetical protein